MGLSALPVETAAVQCMAFCVITSHDATYLVLLLLQQLLQYDLKAKDKQRQHLQRKLHLMQLQNPHMQSQDIMDILGNDEVSTSSNVHGCISQSIVYVFAQLCYDPQNNS